jgi:hypothetical protein
MAVLTWDNVGERYYETGVDRGVLYIPTGGVYSMGYAWNGLVSVTESPSGAEPNAQYADNIKYLNLLSVEGFGGTIEAFTYPPEFAACDGTTIQNAGVVVGQQSRQVFGLSYRTRLGNDALGDDYGYKLHLVYGCLASPSEKAYSTINDSPEPITFSWEFSSTPVAVTGLKPTSVVTVDTTKITGGQLTTLTNALWGTAGTSPRLPLPDEVITMAAGAQTLVTPTAPSFTSPTITIPTVTGVTYRRADTNAVVTGSVTVGTSPGDKLVIRATPASGAYAFTANSDDDWTFTRV